MPNKDETGPEGKGPKTGRMLGKCEDKEPRPKRNRDVKREILKENNEE